MEVMPRWADVVLVPLISVLIAFAISAGEDGDRAGAWATDPRGAVAFTLEADLG